MRIAVISTPFLAVPPKSYGGTELIVYELVEGLNERGHDVTLYTTGDSTPSVPIRSLFARAQWPPEMLNDLNHVSWAIADVARSGGFDILHVHSAAALACIRLLERHRAPRVVYTLHHERDAQLSNFYKYFPDIQYVAISNDQRQREIPLPKVDVIHHGLDPDRYEWSETAGDYLCFLGRFAKVKGPDVAIDVAERAGRTILVAGETHAPDAAWAAIEMEPRLTRQHVGYLGSIGSSVKVPLLRDARALVAPISWNEPFGLVFIEAMLSGCPVVAFRKGSVPEVVDEGITGFIVDSAEAMIDVVKPGGPLEQFDRRRCREHAVSRFSRARLAEDHVRLYERVLADRIPRPPRSKRPSRARSLAAR